MCLLPDVLLFAKLKHVFTYSCIVLTELYTISTLQWNDLTKGVFYLRGETSRSVLLLCESLKKHMTISLTEDKKFNSSSADHGAKQTSHKVNSNFLIGTLFGFPNSPCQDYTVYKGSEWWRNVRLFEAGAS